MAAKKTTKKTKAKPQLFTNKMRVYARASDLEALKYMMGVELYLYGDTEELKEGHQRGDFADDSPDNVVYEITMRPVYRVIAPATIELEDI